MKKIWLLAGIIILGLGINSSLYGFEPQKKALIQIEIKNHDQISEFIDMRLTLIDAKLSRLMSGQWLRKRN